MRDERLTGVILELLRRCGSGCIAPLRVLLFGSALCLAQVLASHCYLKRAVGLPEQRRRFAVLFTSIVCLLGAGFAGSFALVCATSPPCPRGYDLNCDGRAPEMYQAAVTVLLVAWAACLLCEGVWRATRYRRSAPPD